jgi:hypothetical protein
VSGALKSRTTNKSVQLGAKLYEMDEHGHGRLGDGGEIIGDVLLTGVESVSTGGKWRRILASFSTSQFSIWVGSGGKVRRSRCSSEPSRYWNVERV